MTLRQLAAFSAFCGILTSAAARTVIVSAPDASPTDLLAAEELQLHLKLALGREIPIVASAEPDDESFELGTERAKAVIGERRVAALAEEESVYAVRGKTVAIAGGGAAGLCYGVYTYLEQELGARWFDQESGPSIWKVSSLDWRPREYREKPRLAYRSILCTGRNRHPDSRDRLFFFRNRANQIDNNYLNCARKDLNGRLPVRITEVGPGCHSLFLYVPPMPKAKRTGAEGYWSDRDEGYFEDHPDWYTMNESGVRVRDKQLCFTNPGLRRQLAANILERIGRMGGRGFFDCSALDVPGELCHCTNCLALSKKYASKGAPLFDFLHELAPQVKAKHPGATIHFLVYRKDQTQRPPVGMPAWPDNLAAVFAPIDADFAQDFLHANNRDTLEDLRRWCQLVKVWTWYYPYTYGGGLWPRAGLRRTAVDMRLSIEAGLTGAYVEHDVGTAQGVNFADAETWMLLQHYRNPETDWKALRREFFTYGYGPAADLLTDYSDYLESRMSTLSLPWDGGLGWRPSEAELVRFTRLFDDAESLVAADPERLQRVREVRVGWDAMCLVKTCPDLAAVERRLTNTIDRALARRYDMHTGSNPTASLRAGLVKAIKAKLFMANLTVKPLPAQFAGIPEKRIFQIFPHDAMKGRTFYVKDDAAATGFALREPLRTDRTLPKPYPCGFYDKPNKDFVLNAKIPESEFGVNEYRFHKLGTVPMPNSNCYVWFGHSWALGASAGDCYRAGSDDRFDLWASLKFEPDGAVSCDRLVFVRQNECDAAAEVRALPLAFDATAIVVGRETTAAFAAQELNEIVKLATGREFQVKGKGEGEQRMFSPLKAELSTVHRSPSPSRPACNSNPQTLKNSNTSTFHLSPSPSPSRSTGNSNTQTLKNSNTSTVQPSTSNLQPLHRIFLGRSLESERLLGSAFFDSLDYEESCVFAKGNDLFLVGGELGTLWAVYDFCEDSLGYSWPFYRLDGEVFGKEKVKVRGVGEGEGEGVGEGVGVRSISFNGRATRRKPAFCGYRDIGGAYRVGREMKKWHLRNRGNAIVDQFVTNFVYRYRRNVPGHGFLFYLPADDPDPRYGTRPKGIRGQFRDHPEYFSLGTDGRRHPDMQLCLSNPATRAALYAALECWIREKGPGIYMVGSNDNHNTRYCNCPGCIALEKKYDSIGGPLWEFVLEACAKLAANPAYKDVRLQTLAYKGPKQTERAPKGVARFPDNFVCDAAFLNPDRPLRDCWPITLEDGTVFRRWENLLNWTKLCPHVSYWLYNGASPFTCWSPVQTEMRELKTAGVESVYVCGTGGGYEFNDMMRYVIARLLYDPSVDARAIMAKLCGIKYGPAAGRVMTYIEALDAIREREIRKNPWVISCDPVYGDYAFVDWADVDRLRPILAEAQRLAEGTPYADNVLMACLGLDIYSLRFYPASETRGRAAIECYRRHGLLPKNDEATVQFDERANYAFLKSDALPPELAAYPKEKVHLILPPKSRPYKASFDSPRNGTLTSYADPIAASGWAQAYTFPEKVDLAKGVYYEYYDNTHAKWIFTGRVPLADIPKDSYRLFKLGTGIIPPSERLVIGGVWGSPLEARTLSRLYDPSFQGKLYEIWISFRLDGRCLHWDRLYAVDRGVPEGK